jgi:hypothetical protein
MPKDALSERYSRVIVLPSQHDSGLSLPQPHKSI